MDAQKPFDVSATADAILRSSDSVDFFVIKLLLCLVSPVFKDMFSPNYVRVSTRETRNGLVVVSVAESSETLRCFLLLIYPSYVSGSKPVLLIGDLCRVAKAAQKYCMDYIEDKMKEMVITSGLLEEHAFRAYASALHMGWTDSNGSFKHPQNTLSDLPFVDELHIISGVDFYHYLTYRFKHEQYEGLGLGLGLGEEPKLTFVSESPIAADEHPSTLLPTNVPSPFGATAKTDSILRSASESPVAVNEQPSTLIPTNVPSPFGVTAKTYSILRSASESPVAVKEQPPTLIPTNVPSPFGPTAKTDAILRSSDDVGFHVKTSFLSYLSPVFEELFANRDGALSKADEQGSDSPVFTVEEDSDALYGLLCFLHPYADEPSIEDLKLYPKIWTAAQHYEVIFIAQRLEQSFLAHPSIQKEPLRAFAISINLKWAKAIKASAMETLTEPLSDMKYADEIRLTTGADLYRLIGYRFKCANAVRLFLNNLDEKFVGKPSFIRYTAAVKPKLLECPRGISLMKADRDLVKAAYVGSHLSDSGLRDLLNKRRIDMVPVIDRMVSKIPF